MGKIHEIGSSWYSLLKSEIESNDFVRLKNMVENAYQNSVVFPLQHNIFSAFDLCELQKLKVVILGQDPYHGKDQANGLAFSVSDGVKIPPSLKNIFKELENDLHIKVPQTGDLEIWARQGVLLLNSVLTVEENQPASHKEFGWEKFTDAVIKNISDNKKNIVFVLWGKFAVQKKCLIDDKKHFVIQSSHPSPFSVHKGFFGSKPFSKTNNYLLKNGKTLINW